MTVFREFLLPGFPERFKRNTETELAKSRIDDREDDPSQHHS